MVSTNKSHQQAKQETKQAIVIYVPVIHAGYLKLFEKYEQADIYLLDRELLNLHFRSIQKDIRALAVEQIRKSLQILLTNRSIMVLSEAVDFKNLLGYEELILAEDEISDWVEQEYLSQNVFAGKIKHDSIFLRWTKRKARQQMDAAPDKEFTTDQFHQAMMGEAIKEAKKSGDWWRHTGAAIAKDGKLLFVASNRHAPSDQQQYFAGDPRANFSSGIEIGLSTAEHAEELVIAMAAAEGVSLKGADLYATTFPCPYCARLISRSGIKRVFYKDGYALLDGEVLMKGRGIEMIKVRFD